MDFRLTEEHEALRETVREFAREVVAPVIAEHYEQHTFPYEIVRQMGKMGLFGLPFPEEYGGMGGDYFALCLALEELARVDSSVAITLEAAVSLGAMPIYRFGTEEQKATVAAAAGSAARRWPRSASPSRASAPTPAARRPGRCSTSDDEWVINGTQGVHHQLRHRHHGAGHGHRGDRHERRTAARSSPRSSCRPARPASPSRPATPRSAGAPRTPTS